MIGYFDIPGHEEETLAESTHPETLRAIFEAVAMQLVDELEGVGPEFYGPDLIHEWLG